MVSIDHSETNQMFIVELKILTSTTNEPFEEHEVAGIITSELEKSLGSESFSIELRECNEVK